MPQLPVPKSKRTVHDVLEQLKDPHYKTSPSSLLCSVQNSKTNKEHIDPNRFKEGNTKCL